MNTAARRHYFPANDCVVYTEMTPSGQYAAYIANDCSPIRTRGHGFSRLDAIADLVERLPQEDEA